MQTDAFDILEFPSLAAFTSDMPHAGLRVLIATEEIIGPVRNGGIASTYYHLARGLVAKGHEVTVLCLKGPVVENETPEHWIAHYRTFGIDLVYLRQLDENIAAASGKWQGRWLAFYRWLKANDRFDVVHSSEWRGGAFYALQAKRLGLAFQDTLFIMKASSPHVWNRHYQMRPIEKHDLVVASFAEQKCVEWADMVVGGSAHLLSFMGHIGYTLPEGRTYVQPNIVDFSEVLVEDRRPKRTTGDIVKARELVFFGRLEPRKGLDLFVHAVDMLVAENMAIERVTFLGKEGEKILKQTKSLDFIQEHAARWPFPVDIVTDLNQPEALSLMCSRDMIAVMPSLIENSTMAVYEALVHHIPFVATAVGGTPELIAPEYRAATLVGPNVQELSVRLSTVLEGGQVIAGPSFENGANLETWYGFHHFLADKGVADWSVPLSEAIEEQSIACISVPSSPVELARIVHSLDVQPDTVETVICIAFPPADADQGLIRDAAAKGARIIQASGCSIGECFNRAYAETDSAICIFAGTDGIALSPAFFEAVGRALTARPDDFVTSLFRFASEDTAIDTLFAPLGGDPATQTLTRDAYGVELVAGTRKAFKDAGLFEPYRVSAGTIFEFLGRIAAEGRELFAIPEPLFEFSGNYDAITRAEAHSDYLIRKTMLQTTDLAVRKLLLMGVGNMERQKQKNAGPLVMAGAHRKAGSIAWLTNVERQGRLDETVPYNHSIFLGFERERNILRIAVRHTGALVVLLNNEVLRSDESFDSREELEILEFPVLDFLETRPKAHLRIELINENIKAAGVAIQRLEENIHYLSSHRPIYWGSDFDAILEIVESLRAERLRKKALARNGNGATAIKSSTGKRGITEPTVTIDPGAMGLLGRVRRRLGMRFRPD
ncbi:glycosyltransferase family 4 protein [Parasphingopyxis marina]|uniref:Glycosyltransferase family 4 protein n=1 Tax=Parasphingopyxis marina TaxID=2761622 RepID=A0A842I1Y8_9SPHN|nr:glycosyltransferase family 4 protein [Parasphingopyxis marina]MBC2777794.1 glycosyltransferase family 4 protein [Parasphingopyxis marina]